MKGGAKHHAKLCLKHQIFVGVSAAQGVFIYSCPLPRAALPKQPGTTSTCSSKQPSLKDRGMTSSACDATSVPNFLIRDVEAPRMLISLLHVCS